VDLQAKIRTLPTTPGVYLYKNAEGTVIYVGKAKNLRSRVRSYFVEGRAEDAKTGSLLREAVDLEYIVVANEKEALALENNLIKDKQPRFNILLRDDKTYPYLKLTLADPFPRIYVTRRLDKDGSAYYGPFFPAGMAYRVRDLLQRQFGIFTFPVRPGEKRNPALEIHLARFWGPEPERLRTVEGYAQAVREAQLFLEGRQGELVRLLRDRMQCAAGEQQYEVAAKYRDFISTVDQLQEKQRIAAAEGSDSDVFGYHWENHRLAVNLFHVRGGRVLDRREFFWEDLPEEALVAGAPGRHEFDPGEFFSTLLNQLYIGRQYVPRNIYVPVDFEDRESLGELLSDAAGHRVEIGVPQRGEKRSLLDLTGNNAKQSFDQRFRVAKPNARIIAEALREALLLPAAPRRIECFDISHIQGAETVASMVVWEDGRMKKSDYRKFIVRSVDGVDDFASMREVVTRRYRRLLEDKKQLPSLVLIDGGIGQLHAAAEALDAVGVTHQPLASIAKREEIVFVHGRENEPVVLDHHNPVLHLVQMIRDEAHRFAVTFHRKRREMRDRSSELLGIPGIGPSTRRRLLEHFGSLKAVSEADAAALSAVVTKPQAEAIRQHFAVGRRDAETHRPD
jgi:excinuclease ABC subunit C